MFAGRAARQVAKVADEVHLVGVAARGGGGEAPCGAGVGRLQAREGSLESRDPRESLRRQADAILEEPFEMATGEPGP
jgi:hypothetical protein